MMRNPISTADSYLQHKSVLLDEYCEPAHETEGGTTMWDTVDTTTTHLSHDLPCPRCGHGLHTFLACGDDCACEPVVIPGASYAA
jgi:hypothetical protein